VTKITTSIGKANKIYNNQHMKSSNKPYLAPSMKRPWMQAPSLGGACISSLFFFVTSHANPILSNGNSFFRAVLYKKLVWL
jgi:hypothetical protein